MKIQRKIEAKITGAFAPIYYEVLNESFAHKVPEGAESHFRVLIVSHFFEKMRAIQRHRAVNELLADELARDIHALSMHIYTPDEWIKREQNVPTSPRCMGGGK